ncbi:hypothetical protein OUZ56_002686 [Daphnia magna]|uniref:Uncharacterized protein n=1 Tax=Daphnia magna TaxID=35525 RepID=A0ABR0A6G7_9CRUS|nr:hypothetical protein OUZ56_002686 [Daphnia magna]
MHSTRYTTGRGYCQSRPYFYFGSHPDHDFRIAFARLDSSWWGSFHLLTFQLQKDKTKTIEWTVITS